MRLMRSVINKKAPKRQVFLDPIIEMLRREEDWYLMIVEELKRSNRLEHSDFRSLLAYLDWQISGLDAYVETVRVNRHIRDCHLFYSQHLQLLSQMKGNFDRATLEELPNILYFYGELRIAAGMHPCEKGREQE